MKRNKKYILLSGIILILVIICQVFIIIPGHVMNGDYALYIRQALSIIRFDPQEVLHDMQQMLELSTYKQYSPVLYPWGYPLLISPLIHFFGINYLALKVFGAVCLLGSLVCLFAGFSDRKHQSAGLITLFLIGLNSSYLFYSNVTISDIAYLLFVSLAFYLIRIFYRNSTLPVSYGRQLICGLLLFMCFLIRTEGILLSASLFVTQILYFYKNKHWEKRKKTAYLLGGLVPYVSAAILFFVFSIYFPPGFMAHTSHLSGVDLHSILQNLQNLFTMPGEFIFISNTYFFVIFWMFTVLGIYRSFREYSAELTYVFLFLFLLIFWPHSETRYWLTVFPFVIFFCIRGLLSLYALFRQKWVKVVSCLAIGLLMILTIGETAMNLNRIDKEYKGLNPNAEGKTSLEMYRFIQSHAATDDIVACAESRTIYLYTGRISCNLYGDITTTVATANWYVVFNKRGNYLQYEPSSMGAYRKYFKEEFSNEDFTIYKIKKP